MIRKRPPQKLVSFSSNRNDLLRIKKEMNEGWFLISLVQNGNYFVGIMEKMLEDVEKKEDSVFIPPRKKISFTY